MNELIEFFIYKEIYESKETDDKESKNKEIEWNQENLPWN